MAGILNSVTDGLTITEYADWSVFAQRLLDLVQSGRIRRISPQESQHFAKGDEWYLDPQTGEIFVHGIPNAPVLPSWEKFDMAAADQTLEPPHDLSAIPKGEISESATEGLKGLLDFLVRQGAVEPVHPIRGLSPLTSTEKWFKDVRTEIVYRLIENLVLRRSYWERVPLKELQLKTQ